MATYLYTGTIKTWHISAELEAIVQILRAKKIGTLRASNPRLLERQLSKLLPPPSGDGG